MEPNARAQLWAQLASLPGASPETQALARLVQRSLPPTRTPRPHSFKELEKQALANQGRRSLSPSRTEAEA